MNASTARALLVGLLFAVWVWVGYTARLNVSVWAGLVGIGCVFAAGGGVPGLQKALLGTLSGVVWVLLADAVPDDSSGQCLFSAFRPWSSWPVRGKSDDPYTPLSGLTRSA